MQKLAIAIMSAALLLGGIAAPCWADKPQKSPAAKQSVKKAETKEKTEKVYLPSGIKIGEGSVKPGDAIEVVFGVAGPPDAVEALRSKSKKAEDDYVGFAYFDRFQINVNKKSQVQSIKVLDKSVELDGVPFKIGDAKATVDEKWGEPDRSVENMSIYWYRGVYVIFDKSENVETVFFTAPGKTEDSEKKKEKSDS